jgi:hypothetical protein
VAITIKQTILIIFFIVAIVFAFYVLLHWLYSTRVRRNRAAGLFYSRAHKKFIYLSTVISAVYLPAKC